jgi:RNase P subunit RPR2
LAVVKEETALHHCDQCENIYVKYRSLEIHKRRTHNSHLAFPCPECGKLLSAAHALKKHMAKRATVSWWP